MKRILSLLIVCIFVLSLAPAAFALEPRTEGAGWHTRLIQAQERIAARRETIEQKRQEIANFRAAAQERSALVRAAAEENKALRQTIVDKRKELAQVFADLKTNGTKLDTATLQQIANYSQQIKPILEELRASKGSIQDCIAANRESLRSLDYALLESMYTEIAEIQSWRNEQLSEINRILSEILTLVQ